MSIWNKDQIKRKLKALDSNKKFDILIIGAGITGMTTAYYLKNKNICIVDANKIGYGSTLNTTAKINYLQDIIYTKIKNKDDSRKYLESQIFAISELKNIIEKENIKCDFEKVTSYVFANQKKEIKKIEKEVEFLKNNNVKIAKKNMPDKIKSYSSYSVDDTYIFNPIKYLNGIYKILKKNNIEIYENSKILKIEKLNSEYICYGDKYNIIAKKVVLACHYPFFLIPFLLPIKSYIEKSYIIISKVKKDGHYTCINTSNPTYSCRFYNDGKNIYQIALGESHNTSFKQNDKLHFSKLKKMFNLSDKDIVESYTNTDIITLDKMPYIGELKENIYIGCGYNTWGMTNGVLAANIISDLILEKNNKYKEMFDPNRLNIFNISFPYVLFSQAKSYITTKLNKNKKWYPKNITFSNIDGDIVGIYKDSSFIEHKVYNKCPHLGCSLIFNEKEKTWDCPCHSSRFDLDGKCIKGPSNYDISYTIRKK